MSKMDFGYLKLVVALVVAEGVWSLPLGCRDNGKSYREGEVVQTREPCLSCVCRKGGLACSLRVCADYVEALPPGCFLVHERDDCCPRLFCEGGFSPNGIELRTAAGTGSTVEGNGCVINGTVYGEGSAVASREPCEYCYCTEGGIKCVKPRCVESFEGCKAVYEKFSCCPTHFDCRDAKVSFLVPRVKHIGNLHSEIPKDAGMNSEVTKEDANGSWREEEGSTAAPPLEEETTEDSMVATGEEMRTEGTTSEDQPETTTSEYLTTFGLQTSEVVDSRRKESSAVESTEETTPGVTTEAVGGTEEGEGESEGSEGSERPVGSEGSERPVGSETLGVESEKPVDVSEAVGNRWNSSQMADDYDTYDYGEPKLPPSLPNLVIFPFVAADAVVKDERAELYEEVQVERVDDQPVVFKDYFSPPTRTEGGFVPKQPSSEPFYDLPFLMKEPTKRPTEALTEKKRTEPHINDPASSSTSDDNRRMELSQEVLLPQDGNSPGQPGPFDPVLPTEMLSSLRKSQQTNNPVTVAYKNVILDFYPDRLVTTTRTRSTTRSELLLAATDDSPQPQPQHTNPTALLPLITPPYSPLPFFDEPTTTTQQTAPSITEPALTSTTGESSFFDHFLKSFLSEATTPSVTALTTNNKHKYSSKIKARISTTAKPKRQHGAASVLREIPNSLPPGSEGPFTTLHFHAKERPHHSLTTTSSSTSTPSPSPTSTTTLTTPSSTSSTPSTTSTTTPTLSSTQHLASPASANLRGSHNPANKLRHGPHEGPDRIHPNPGTLLKLAGCNIYGMMYRIGKVIAELSGPCVQCLCTDLGVQCTPLDC